MSREREFNAGGAGQVNGTDIDPDVDVETEEIQLQAPEDYGSLAWSKTGRYHDAYYWNISPTTDRFVKAAVPPGNSFNPDHYATDDGLEADYDESSSEVVDAMIRLEGQMQQRIDADITWLKPDGSVAFELTVQSDPPPDCGQEYCWWAYYYIHSFIGRDFSHGANTEIDQLGTYTVEFDTNYGTYTDTIELIGPSATSCQVPNEIQTGESGEFGVTIEKQFDDDNSYTGDVVVAREMTDTYTDRDVIHREPFSISQVASTKAVSFDVPAAKFDQFGGLGSDTPVMLYLETYGF
jgi:hypothetical protein